MVADEQVHNLGHGGGAALELVLIQELGQGGWGQVSPTVSLGF